MSKSRQHSMPQEQFLTAACNILHKSFVEAGRADAKNRYKAASEGQRVALVTVRMEDGSDLRFDVSLDTSEFRGKLNFRAFRASVTQLLAVLSRHLRARQEVPVFSEENAGSVLFGAPGVSQEGAHVNVMMLGADMSAAGSVLLQLMYMDPAQFAGDAQGA